MRSLSHRVALATLPFLGLACGSAPPARAPAQQPPSPTPGATVAAKPGPAPAPPALRLPDTAAPTAYRLRLEVDPARDTFAGHIDIDAQLTAAADHVWLNAQELTITSPTFTVANGAAEKLTPIAGGKDTAGFGFGRAVGGAVTLHFDFAGKAPADAMEGLFREQDDNHWYLYTQLESVFARKVFPSFDEPQFKVPWQVTLVIPAGQVGLSNTPVQQETRLADGRVELVFAPTPPLPSYLVAIAVGPFELVDVGPVGRNHIPSRIAALAGKAAQVESARQATPRLIAALEDYFDMAYPYPKLDQVVVPRFFGAMENPGLVTYASSILAATKASDTEPFRRAMIEIAGHELAHQWFGDYVTLAWWDDTWLNESFATWMADRAGEAIDPRWDSAIRNVEEAETAMRADASAGARPLHRPIASTNDIAGAFDDIAYEKGGTVLSMFERWIGRDRFRDGVRGYLRKHGHSIATSADFLAALAEVSTPDVQKAFTAFLEQPGVPVVTASLSCAGKPALAFTQRRLAPVEDKAVGSWPLPICLRYPSKGATGARAGVVERCQLVEATSGSIALDAPSCPPWVVVNAGAAGYYRVQYDAELSRRLVKALPALEPAERLGFAGDIGALVQLGHVDVGVGLELSRALLAGRDQHDLLAATRLLAGNRGFIDLAHRPAWQRYLRTALGARARKAGLTAPADATPAVRDGHRALVMLVAVEAEDPVLTAQARALAVRWLDGKATIPATDLPAVLAAAAVLGDAGLFERFEARARASADDQERRALLGALATFKDSALTDRALGLMSDGNFKFQDVAAMAGGLFGRPTAQAQVWAGFRGHFDAIAAKMPAFVRGYLVFVASDFCSPALRGEVQDFFAKPAATWANGSHNLEQVLEQIDRCVARRTRSASAIDRWFPPTT